MKLSELLVCCMPLPRLKKDPLITGLCIDTRHLKSGELFFAYQGGAQDGRLFMTQALSKGAAAIVYEKQNLTAAMQAQLAACDVHIPCIAVEAVQEKIGFFAAQFFNHPATAMHITGVTGTNGKTSCVYFLTQAFSLLNKKAAMMGTIGVGCLEQLQESVHTTVDAILMQDYFQQFKQTHIAYVNMEVSSHALMQGRVTAVPFEVAIFTNLTPDHLDYHQTMQAYGAAKGRLFQYPNLKYAVINLDDPFASELIDLIAPCIAIIGVSVSGKTHARCTQLLSAQRIQLNATGTQADLVIAGNTYAFHTALLGEFNVSNLLLVLGALLAQDIPLAQALPVLAQLHAPPGRLTRIDAPNSASVFVDYAHTPDALEKVLAVLKPLCAGELWCVFGCGGDRDKTKRPLMAQAVEKYATHIIVTDDNPRTEDAEAIVAQILTGFSRASVATVEHSRAKAIALALTQAKPNDFVLIAGKGHEDYQIIGNEKHFFSDVNTVREILLSS